MPSLWHKRHAMLVASQLPDDHVDRRLIIQALIELEETYMMAEGGEGSATGRPSNVLPFMAG
jgi:hypothetical protein